MNAKLTTAGLALAILLCGARSPAQNPNSLIGKPAPKLQVQNWTNSKPLTLQGLRGKVVVLDFWAYW